MFPAARFARAATSLFVMTLPLLLAAAAEHAAPAGPIDGLRQTFEHFGVETKYIVYQLISFLVVLGVLYKFGIKPVTATMEERNRKIEAGIKYSEQMQAKLAATQQETAGIIKNANVEASRIIEDARRSAKDFLDRQTQDATARASDLLVKAQQAIELEHKKMLADARTEIARLVVTTTERVLAKRLSDTDRAAYNEAASRELTSV
ncbi:MAG: synthase subunit b, sodium ion specific [Verrucomicrobiota bacterium]|jgi:F-type H+-transporting ATPase subunit b